MCPGTPGPHLHSPYPSSAVSPWSSALVARCLLVLSQRQNYTLPPNQGESRREERAGRSRKVGSAKTGRWQRNFRASSKEQGGLEAMSTTATAGHLHLQPQRQGARRRCRSAQRGWGLASVGDGRASQRLGGIGASRLLCRLSRGEQQASMAVRRLTILEHIVV